MTYEEATANREDDLFEDRYVWHMCPERGYGGRDMLDVRVYRLRDMQVWSAALGANVYLDKVLERMHACFNEEVAEGWPLADDLRDNGWGCGTERELKELLIRQFVVTMKKQPAGGTGCFLLGCR